jgi:hypothetical protein
MIISSSKVSSLIREKVALIKAFDRKEVTETEFKSKFLELENAIKAENEILIRKERLSVAKEIEKPKGMLSASKITKEEGDMAEEKKAVEVKAEKPKKEKKPSNCGLILKALCRKSTKDLEGVVRYVKENNPDVIEKNIKGQAASIIKMVKAGNKRFANYSWDEASFLMTEKA